MDLEGDKQMVPDRKLHNEEVVNGEEEVVEGKGEGKGEGDEMVK